MSRPLDLRRLPADVVLVAVIGAIVALAAALARIGSDAQWLAALGGVIAHQHAVPAGVPFAASPTAHWPNVLVLAELIFSGLEHTLGDRGLELAQLLAVAGGLAILAADARAGQADGIGAGAALGIAALGGLSSLAIVRVQLFSLVLFPALVALLRAEARAPSRRIWLVVPLLALWSNLHGAALLGLGIVLAHLVLDRGRRAPVSSAALGAAAAGALCLTPALWRTVAYYHGVMTNAAAQSGQGMWGPLSLHNPLDVVLALAAIVLIVRLRRARVAAWEWVVVLALAAACVHAERNGIWLLFFAAPPAARALAPARSLRALVPVAATLGAVLLVVALVRGPAPTGAGAALVRGAVAMAHGTPVLADGSIDEQVALAGGRIWAGNPIDAFSRPVQQTYLNWVAGDAAGARALTRSVRVVVVTRGSPTQALMARMPSFTAARADAGAILYQRVGAGAS